MSSARVIGEALERTQAAGVALIEFTSWYAPPRVDASTSSSSEGGLGSRAGGLVLGLLGAAVNHAVDAQAAKGGRRAPGVMDLAGDRVQYDLGEYAVLESDDRHYHGRSGNRLAAAGRSRPTANEPLWLLRALAGAVESSAAGADQISTRECTRVDVLVDLIDADAASPHGLALPAARHVRDLKRLPLTVWIDDDGLIRRVMKEQRRRDDAEFDFPAESRYTVTFLRFGFDGSVRWDHLPNNNSA